MRALLEEQGTLVVSSGGQGTSTDTINYKFVQEDGRRRKTRQRACKTSEPVWQEEPVVTPSQTPETVSNLERRHSRPQLDLVPVLYSRQPEYFQFPSSTLEQVAFFTWTFSPVTLTYDVKANPWQACIPQFNRAPFLLDAVRALAIRHRSHLEETQESLSVLDLKDKALTSFARSIGKVPLEVGISVSLILIGIDYAESAFGSWIVHLRGVRRMIEAAGGIQLGNADVHLRAQIAQLVWYDTIVALLSRRDPIFPQEYIEYVLSWKSESQWSLLALNGFPDSAFLHMYEIAKAAAHASSLSDGQVAGLEMKLWLAPFDTDQGTTDKEIAALADCWRLGLLLYCTRVFHRGESAKRKARVLAEEIIWLVHEIPPDSNKQKQALLPLFLAASEIDTSRFRRIAVDFCERWKKRSGIWLNQTAVELLKTVWAAVDENPDKDIWWGDFVNPPLDSGFLFG
ncbi:Fc.00g093180.m01.CDS01 [Cosmosporella sp. VM-42]